MGVRTTGKIMLVETFDYKKWADERTLQAIEKVNVVTSGNAYNFMLQQLNHIVIVEELFKSRLLNVIAPHEKTNTKHVPEFNELKERLLISGKWYQEYIAGLENEPYKTSISFVFADGKSGSMTIEEILFHIINHGSYHRGSIAHSLDLAGVSHPADGYGIYIHEKAPERRF